MSVFGHPKATLTCFNFSDLLYLVVGRLKVWSYGATSRRDTYCGDMSPSESRKETVLGENKSHKRLYRRLHGHTKRHFFATNRCVNDHSRCICTLLFSVMGSMRSRYVEI
jgi:hypothetical protein